MRRLAWLGIVLVACSGQPSGSTSSQTPAPCRLAVIQGSPGQGSGPQTPGFLTIPGNHFTVATNPGSGLYYDRPLRRWVGGWRPLLSADGLRYAYIDGDTTVSKFHLVDLRSGSDQVVASGGPWLPVGLDPDWFYVMRVEYIDSPAYGQFPTSKGLWKLPLTGGAPVQLTSDSRDWVWVAQGGVFGAGSTYDVAGGPNDIVRLDVKSLQVTTWLDKHARSRFLAVGADGAALVTTEAADFNVWSVTGPGRAVEVWSGSYDIFPNAPVAVDGSDVWLSSAALTSTWAIYHFSPGTGLKQAALFTDRPVTVAGPCA